MQSLYNLFFLVHLQLHLPVAFDYILGLHVVIRYEIDSCLQMLVD